MTGIQYIRSLHEVCVFQTTERGVGPATNSELTRLLKSKALHINGQAIAPTDKIPHPIKSVVLFPNSRKKRTTLL
jgi:hypothetical protein